MTDEKIWNKFTDLKYSEMASLAEEALENIYIFKCSDYNAGFERASKNMYFAYKKDYRLFTTMILEAYKDGCFELTNDDQWCLLNLNNDTIFTSYDLLEMLSDFETEIVEGLKDNEETLETLGK